MAENTELDVLFVNGCDLPHPSRYRVEHQMEQLRGVGLKVDAVHYGKLRPEDERRGAAIVFFRCPLTDVVRQTIDQAHNHGKNVWFDVDDLVIDTSYTNGLPVLESFTDEERRIFNEGVRRTGEALSLCDGAIASTAALAGELEKFTGYATINRNVASAEMAKISERAHARRSPRAGGQVRIGYLSGTLTHNKDFELIAGSLARVLAARSEAVFVTTGLSDLPEELAPFEDRVIRQELVDWRKLPQLVASLDINLAPLEDTLFNAAKSENKWVDASLVGVPTVASDVGAFAEMIEDGETGILCSTEAQWEAALLRLVDDAAECERLGEAARVKCLRDCTTRGTGAHLAHELTGRWPDIQDMLPTSEREQQAIVRDFLSARGVHLPRRHRKADAEPWASHTLDERVAGIRNAHAAGKRVALLIYEMTSGDTPTFRYFGYNVAQALGSSATWHATWLFTSELDSLGQVIDQIDVAVLIRMRIRPDIIEAVNALHDAGRPVAYLMDDDALGKRMAPVLHEVMGLTPGMTFERDFWTGVAIRFEQAANLCDAFIAATPALAKVFEEHYGKPTFIVRSSLNEEQIEVSDSLMAQRSSSKAGDGFHIGYFSGSGSHSHDFELVQEDVLRLLHDHEDAHLVIGGHLPIDESLAALWRNKRVTLLPFVDYATLQSIQASLDVVLAPLVRSEFSDCKSALKVYEAGAVGTPALASGSPSYAEAIDDGKSGFICDDQGFLSALEALHGNAQMLHAMGDAARERVLSLYSPQALCRDVEQALGALAMSDKHGSRGRQDATMGAIAAAGLDWDDQFQVNPCYAQDEKGLAECVKERSVVPETPGTFAMDEHGHVGHYSERFLRKMREDGIAPALRRGAQIVFNKLSETVYHQQERLDAELSADEIYERDNPQKVRFFDVLFVNGCDYSVPHPVRYRVDHQMEQLEAQGLTCQKIDAWELQEHDVANARSIIIFRCPYTEEIGRFIRKAKKLNKRVYYDIDDLVIDTKYTDTIPAIAAMGPEDRALYDDGVRRMGQTLVECGAAITTTERMAEELSHYVDEVFINRNVASLQMELLSERALSRRGEASGCVTIGYFSGSITHNADFEMVMPAIARVMGERDNVRLKVVGELDIPDELSAYADRVDFAPFCAWEELPALIASVDINLAPLEESIFNEAKSENKWVEAALVKVPTVASNLGAFAHAIEHGETGLLCSTEDEWHETLLQLVDSADERLRLGSNAYSWCKENAITLGTGKRLADYLTSRQAPNIMFLMAGIGDSGGDFIAKKHACILQDAGYDVFLGDNSQEATSYWESFECHQLPIRFVLSGANKNDTVLLRGSIDQVVATLWLTLSEAMKLPNARRISYLVQNFEPGFYPDIPYFAIRASGTYSKDRVEYLTISKWCQRWLKEGYGTDSRYAPNGIDIEQFSPIERDASNRRIRILIEGDSQAKHKNVAEGFEIVRRLDPDKYEIWYLSYWGIPKPGWRVDKAFNKIPHDRVAEIYQQCDILIKTSTLESFSYPPLEMMSTGGAVVVVPNDGNAEFIEDGKNCLTYEQGDIEAGVACVERIADDAKLRERLRKGGIKTAEEREWSKLREQILALYR